MNAIDQAGKFFFFSFFSLFLSSHVFYFYFVSPLSNLAKSVPAKFERLGRKLHLINNMYQYYEIPNGNFIIKS
jgi:hypothetical protein